MNSDDGAALLGSLAALFSGVFALIMLVVAVIMIASMWKVFTKAGQPGWAAIVPIYNVIVLLQIAGKPLWWIVLFIIPLVNIVVGIMVVLDLAKSFGQSTGFALGLLFLGFIFYPILGFGPAQYLGPAGLGRPALGPI
jgi:hypothetical protein